MRITGRSNHGIPASGSLLFIFALVLVLGGRVAPAHALESEDWAQYDGWKVTSLRLEGLPAPFRREVAKGLALGGEWKLLQGRQLPPFSEKLLAADLARIRIYLASRGYPAASPVPLVTARPADRRLALVIRVALGDPVRIGEVRTAAWPTGVAWPDSGTPGIPDPGDIFTDAAVATGLAAFRSHLRNAGYAQAKVTADVRPRGRGEVALWYMVTPGDYYTIDEVTVSGCSEDLVPLARRVLDLPLGEPYAEDRLATASLDLRLTQLYRQLDLGTEVIAPGSLRLQARLEDGRMRSWDAAIGTWSDNPWMVKTSWTHRNLFHRGRGFDVRGSLATHELNLGAGVFWLGWLSPRARTRVGLDYIVSDEDAYRSDEYRLELLQSFRPRGQDILNLGTTLSENRIDVRVDGDSSTPDAQGRLWEFWVNRKWDRTNDPVAPSQGGFVKVSLTCAEPWLLSEVPYASGQIDAARYLDLPLGMVLTGRVRAGVAVPLEEGFDVIATRRFYAGGYNTHRGYQRRALGPRDSDDAALGGEVISLLGGELRLPLLWLLEGGLFVDGGNVWGSLDEFDAADYPLAVGVTVAVRTLIGPLRVGYAVNVSDLVQDQPRRLWHFGIGYPW